MTKIYGIGSIMGSGKTTWAINYINSHKDRRFIYCTPFVDEVQRIITACPHFKEPTYKNPAGTKQADFMKLLQDGECIATTHELFEHVCVTDGILSLIRECGYILILDEVIEVVEKVKATSYDIQELQQYVRIDEKSKRLIWTDNNYKGDHTNLKRLIKTKTVIQYKDNLLLWLFPISLLSSFEEIYILTFLFEKSYMEQYLLIHGFQYDQYHIQNGILVKGTQSLEAEKRRIRSLINIYSGHLNGIGDARTALSVTWWKKSSNSKEKNTVKRNTSNYLRNVLNAKSAEVLWTVFKGNARGQKEMSINGRWSERYCPCNARATNTWRESNALAYLVNIYQDPSIVEWFRDNGGCVDEEQYALSTMLQWIWRSAIRDGKKVNLYIPSKRMREMLINWLDSDSEHEVA